MCVAPDDRRILELPAVARARIGCRRPRAAAALLWWVILGNRAAVPRRSVDVVMVGALESARARLAHETAMLSRAAALVPVCPVPTRATRREVRPAPLPRVIAFEEEDEVLLQA